MAARSDLPKYTVPSLTPEEGAKIAGILQERLHALNDLQLTLKHIHWNVVGPHFIAVHEMIDPQVDAVRAMVDATAERIATLGVITAHREAAAATEELDDVTNDLLIGHLHDLELFHWFVRAHLESTGGDLSTEGARTEAGAARKAEEAAAGQP